MPDAGSSYDTAQGSFPKHLQIAITQIGIAEPPGIENGGTPSIRYMGGRREPWCAHFVCWCFREAGYPFPGYKPACAGPPFGQREAWNPLASVAELQKVCQTQGWFIPPMASAAPAAPTAQAAPTIPASGDLIFLNERGASDKGPGNHVGIVYLVATTSKGLSVSSVDGNWKNQVSVVHRQLGAPEIAGYAHVELGARK